MRIGAGLLEGEHRVTIAVGAGGAHHKSAWTADGDGHAVVLLKA
ncbi:unannotated protein [freshwater metagenome]|uniref:Unannotated protein n=1 Tax=freshwater metagenome TaxID=449393 RepID=A0A6J6XJA7_9ZZZZ